MSTHGTTFAGLTAQCRPHNTDPLTSFLLVTNVLLLVLVVCAIQMLHIVINHYRNLAHHHHLLVTAMLVLVEKAKRESDRNEAAIPEEGPAAENSE